MKNVKFELFDIVRDGIPELENYDIVGFAAFTNYSGIPYIFQNFMEMLTQQNNKPAFVFNTYGFIKGLDHLISLIKSGGELHQKKIKVGIIDSLFKPLSSDKARKQMGSKFVDVSLCTECGLCGKLCPYLAIKCSPKPVLDMNKCCGCWTCYNHCPVKVIYAKKFRGVGHYPQPINQLKEKLSV